jgi:hypothetical protein
VGGDGFDMSMTKEQRIANEPSHPSAGGRMNPNKPDIETDSLLETGPYPMQTEFEAKDRPGAALAAGKKQREDAAGCDETYRNPCNTSCNHK